MKHRQHRGYAIRKVVMNHQGSDELPRRIGFVSNKCTPSKESGFFACISSRITTVIQVVLGIIKWTITDLMSHSQFRSINAYT